jgi:hypothetical protein
MSTEQENKPEPTCFTCHKPIVFDWSKKGKNNRPIPLDPETKEPHHCPTEEKKEEAGTKQTELSKQNEEKLKKNGQVTNTTAPPVESGKEPVKAEYVDHTLARPSEVKIFFSNHPKDVEEEYKQFQEGKRFAWTRAQYEAVRDEDNKVLFTICLFYEVAK